MGSWVGRKKYGELGEKSMGSWEKKYGELGRDKKVWGVG